MTLNKDKFNQTAENNNEVESLKIGDHMTGVIDLGYSLQSLFELKIVTCYFIADTETLSLVTNRTVVESMSSLFSLETRLGLKKVYFRNKLCLL